MRNLSGSNFGLATLCTWWLRDEAAWEETKQTPEMAAGNAFHKCCELDIIGKPVDVKAICDSFGLRDGLAELTATKFALWKEWAKHEKRVGWQPEVKMAYNTANGKSRILQGQGPAAYRGVDRVCEMTMGLDVVTMGVDDMGSYLEVIDWKTGRYRAKDRDQVNGGCLAAARHFDVQRARGRVVSVTDSIVDHYWWLDEFDLDCIEADIKRIFKDEERIAKPGLHCKDMWCKARLHCELERSVDRGTTRDK